MRLAVMIPLLAFAACSASDDKDTDPGLTCDDAETQPLSTIAVTDWPTGLDATIPAFRTLAGQWDVSSCGTESNLLVDIQLPATNDGFEVITAGLPASVTCGPDDERFASDYGLDPIAFATADIAVIGFAEPVLATLQVDAAATLFAGAASALQARTYGTYTVPVAELSRFETADVVVRVEGGAPSGQVTITTNTESTTCQLAGWTRR